MSDEAAKDETTAKLQANAAAKAGRSKGTGAC